MKDRLRAGYRPWIAICMPYDPDTTLGGHAAAFPLTRWSVIRAASEGEPMARDALSAIIELYWKPVYKYVRLHWKRSNEDAKDVVQSFFAALLEQDMLSRFDPAKGTFRTWLRACVDHFVLKQNEFASRLKRGGHLPEPLDFDSAEGELALAATNTSPEDLFFREWRRQAFTLALADLRRHCLSSGRSVQWEIFAAYDLAEAGRPRYADLAARYNVSTDTVTNYLAWARRELRRMVLERLAAVTSGGSELHSEARTLFGRP